MVHMADGLFGWSSGPNVAHRSNQLADCAYSRRYEPYDGDDPPVA